MNFVSVLGGFVYTKRNRILLAGKGILSVPVNVIRCLFLCDLKPDYVYVGVDEMF